DTPVFIHLCFNNIHIQSFLEILEEINKAEKHTHYAFVEKRRSISNSTIDLSKLSYSKFFDGQRDLPQLLKITNEALRPTAIIVHGLFFPWQKKFIKKAKKNIPIYWSIWGGDLYNPIRRGMPLFDISDKID